MPRVADVDLLRRRERTARNAVATAQHLLRQRRREREVAEKRARRRWEREVGCLARQCGLDTFTLDTLRELFLALATARHETTAQPGNTSADMPPRLGVLEAVAAVSRSETGK